VARALTRARVVPPHRVTAREAGGHPTRGAGARARPPARRGGGHAPGDGRAQPGDREQGAARPHRQPQGLLARGPRPPLDGDDLGAVRAAWIRARPVGMNVRLGTRGSRLALIQCEQVAAGLRAHGARAGIVVIRTSGDRLAQVALAAFGGKALFVKEIEEALLAGQVDVGVHSLKDMPAALPAGLTLAAFPAREDPADVLLTRGPGGWDGLPRGARVGTSRLRRRALALALAPAPGAGAAGRGCWRAGRTCGRSRSEGTWRRASRSSAPGPATPPS